MAHRSDQDRIEKTHNVPRFFVEHPQVSWVLLVGVLIWGWVSPRALRKSSGTEASPRTAKRLMENFYKACSELPLKKSSTWEPPYLFPEIPMESLQMVMKGTKADLDRKTPIFR